MVASDTATILAYRSRTGKRRVHFIKARRGPWRRGRCALFGADLDAAMDLAHGMHGFADDRRALLGGHRRLRPHLGPGAHMAGGMRLIQANGTSLEGQIGESFSHAASSYVS